ncbi:3-isopropylmalate dehydratase small subunit [Pseudalkalibacillus caeni]|uniref:3-isopropylmalate dehydratase small subunit n=1 Tax=Exobacillus caeni TaxID=2574798 RepID=A0A5R9F911_9BACL|nr:3-isopropylmalate dehydratase small subunit [Pseudalkalibacillus caeni]TLS38806.1 3-isopropylmalate dehydratase small subunit [Pseudalkalibacillus caeni]
MEPIKQFSGTVCPLDRSNVDTDQIIPKQFLKRIERTGFGQFLFYHWRLDEEGKENEAFVLNKKQYKDASILVAGNNFGCGSSREHAPWALLDYGFRVVIAPSFADIFYNNCLKNGILPISLSEEQVGELLHTAEGKQTELFVDLEQQKVTNNNGFSAEFQIDPYWKQMLLNGWDEISLTLTLDEQITKFEKSAMVKG